MYIDLGICESTDNYNNQALRHFPYVSKWYLEAQTGQLQSRYGLQRQLCPKLEEGDTVGFFLDMNKHGMLFLFVNDLPCGLAFSGLHNYTNKYSKLYFAASLYHVHDRILLANHACGPPLWPLSTKSIIAPCIFDTSRSRQIRSSDGLSIVSGITLWQTLRTTRCLRIDRNFPWQIQFDNTTGMEYIRFGILLNNNSSYHDKYFTNMEIDSVIGIQVGSDMKIHLINPERPSTPTVTDKSMNIRKVLQAIINNDEFTIATVEYDEKTQKNITSPIHSWNIKRFVDKKFSYYPAIAFYSLGTAFTFSIPEPDT